MDVKKLAQDLIPLVGGKDNIKGVLHCMTRLRFQLADMSKAILVIMVALGLSDESIEYYILNFIADSGFYFFPVVLAFSSAQKF